VDGTDNFPTRYLVNDACVLLGKPNVYGSIFRFEGQASVFDATLGPCYRCLYPEPPPPGLVPSCAEGGVLGVLPGIIGAIQAIETVKIILGQGEPLVGRLVLFDALALRFRELKLRKNPECPLCGENPTITELIDYHQFCGIPAGPSPEQLELERSRGAGWEITPVELKAALDAGATPYLLDVREPHEAEICQIPGTDRLIPHESIAAFTGELDPGREIILYCKGGVRSAKALDALRKAGFTNLRSLKGGILGWSREVDPSVPQY
jgi:sulfur-carrier protein adenylyltransferase/sulfurtransferase